MKLIGVYNADGGFAGEVSYFGLRAKLLMY